MNYLVAILDMVYILKDKVDLLNSRKLDQLRAKQ